MKIPAKFMRQWNNLFFMVNSTFLIIREKFTHFLEYYIVPKISCFYYVQNQYYIAKCSFKMHLKK